MTFHFRSPYHRVRFTLIIGLITALLGGYGYWSSKSLTTPLLGKAFGRSVQNEAFFVGLRKVKPAEVLQILPESKNKPLLLVFSSRFCHDCQRLAPILSKLSQAHPSVAYRKLDINEANNKAPAILRAFKPVSVPVMIFIRPGGEIQTVLYNYQPTETIAAAITQLETSAAPSKAVSKAKFPKR